MGAEPGQETEPPRFRPFAFTQPCESLNPEELTGAGDGRLLQAAAVDGITEAELRAGIERGEARVSRVVVVLLDRAGEYELYFRLAGRSGYLPLLKRRREGVRTWNDFRNLQKFVATAGGYRGPVHVYPEDWPTLTRLGIPAHPV